MLEKFVGFSGLLLVVCLLLYLCWQAFMGEQLPPDISVEVKEIQQNRDDHLLIYQASNRGTQAAADVRVVGQLLRDGELVEESEVTLDYVAGRSDREGGLFFDNDPRQLEIILRASGYTTP